MVGVGVIDTTRFPPDSVRVLGEIGSLEFGELKMGIFFEACMII